MKRQHRCDKPFGCEICWFQLSKKQWCQVGVGIHNTLAGDITIVIMYVSTNLVSPAPQSKPNELPGTVQTSGSKWQFSWLSHEMLHFLGKCKTRSQIQVETVVGWHLDSHHWRFLGLIAEWELHFTPFNRCSQSSCPWAKQKYVTHCFYMFNLSLFKGITVNIESQILHMWCLRKMITSRSGIFSKRCSPNM